MVDRDQEKTTTDTVEASLKRKQLLSTAMKRTSDWIFSQEIPSDVTIEVGTASFQLHKFPLVSKCGYIRKLVSESSEADVSLVELHDVPGGSEAFELAAKFCYGINFEISIDNIAMLRCVAEYLEMTEDYSVGNLVARTDAYLNEVALKSLAGAVSILHLSESLLPIAEKAKLEIFGKGRKKIEPRQEHEKRVVLETIVSLLPKEKNAMSVSFLSMLLRAAIYLETTVACRLDLEKRMSVQLGQAVLDDLLIPSYSFTGDTLFDVDTVQRIMMNYLESETMSHSVFSADNEYFSPPQTDMERVGKLMENYLAEIATDRNLPVPKFITLAELIPEKSRPTEDGMYRAIDIYLKAHPDLSDMEKKKVCSVMDCQKLSREACAHAAQNDRLPVQTVVQVLYYEQQRLRDAMNGGEGEESAPSVPSKLNVYSADLHPVSNELSSLRRENEDLKLELVKLKMRLKEIEKSATMKSSAASSPVIGASPSSADKPPLPRKSFINSVSKKLGRLSPFLRSDGVTPSAKGRTKPNKNRRHSIS
ncbi:BTB/POZ domain-containing protein SR1IP1-like isoform X2 [Neltuma alba]|uniref:BTB/POZ domain-containing protein SR1IP1-like isoform X2 n=1 Tax=Neltuma alba TaxID=207710 RepID=UPI0010A3703A|nr:BTB/POZ domain-containing protein SR1IP1-like isoform X2 [Prosopis alba]